MQPPSLVRGAMPPPLVRLPTLISVRLLVSSPCAKGMVGRETTTPARQLAGSAIARTHSQQC
eukprot:1190333-Pleurochrysis_carterae.AAC.1